MLTCVSSHFTLSSGSTRPRDDSGDILRWVFLIDGEEVREAEIRVTERDGFIVMLLTDHGEEIELTRWREGHPGTLGKPSSFVGTLGGIQRHRGS